MESRPATDQEMFTLSKFGLPIDADQTKVWLNVSKSEKNYGRKYWSWGHAFLFFDDKKYSIHKRVALGSINPDEKPKQINDENAAPTPFSTPQKNYIPPTPRAPLKLNHTTPSFELTPEYLAFQEWTRKQQAALNETFDEIAESD